MRTASSLGETPKGPANAYGSSISRRARSTCGSGEPPLTFASSDGLAFINSAGGHQTTPVSSRPAAHHNHNQRQPNPPCAHRSPHARPNPIGSVAKLYQLQNNVNEEEVASNLGHSIGESLSRSLRLLRSFDKKILGIQADPSLLQHPRITRQQQCQTAPAQNLLALQNIYLIANHEENTSYFHCASGRLKLQQLPSD